MSRSPLDTPYVSQASAAPSQLASFQRAPSSIFDGGMRLGGALQQCGSNLDKREKDKAIKLENSRRTKFLAQTTPLMHEIENDFKQGLFHLVNDPDNQGADLQVTARDYTETWIANIDSVIEGKGEHKKMEGLIDIAHDPDNPFTDSDSWSATGQLDKLKSRLWSSLDASMPTIQRLENSYVKKELHNTIHRNVNTGLDEVRVNPTTLSSNLRDSLSELNALPRPDRPAAKAEILNNYNTAFIASATESINGYLSTSSLDGLDKSELDQFFSLIDTLSDQYSSAFKTHDNKASQTFNSQVTPILAKFLQEQALTPIDKKGTTTGQYFSKNMSKGIMQAIGKQYPSLTSLFGFDKLASAAASGQKQVTTQLTKEINSGIDRIDKAINLLSAPTGWFSPDNQMAAEELFHKDASIAFQQLNALRQTPGYDSTDDKLGDELESKFVVMSSLLAARSGKNNILVGTPTGESYTGEKWYKNTFLKDGQTDNKYLEKISTHVRKQAKQFGLEIDQLTLQSTLLDESSGFKEALINQYNSRIEAYRDDGNDLVGNELLHSGDPILEDLGKSLLSLNQEFKDNPSPESYNRLLNHATKVDSHPAAKKYNLLDANDSWSVGQLSTLLKSGSEDFDGFKRELAQASQYGFLYGKFLNDLNKVRSPSLLKGYPFAAKVIEPQALDNLASNGFDVNASPNEISDSWKEVEDHMDGMGHSITGSSFDGGSPSILDLFNNALNSNPTGDVYYNRSDISGKAKRIAQNYAHAMMSGGMSAKDVAKRFRDQLSRHKWIIHNGQYFPVQFNSIDTPEGQGFQGKEFFHLYDEATQISRWMNQPDYIAPLTKEAWGSSVFDLPGDKLWAGDQRLNLIPKIPTFFEKASDKLKGIFDKEATFLRNSLERETRFIIDPDSGYATLGYNTTDNVKGGYTQIQPLYFEKDGDLVPIQMPIDELFNKVKGISKDLVNKNPGIYYKKP